MRAMRSVVLPCVAAIAFAACAEASAVTTPPPSIVALGGDVTVVFIYADAADTSVLGIATPSPAQALFCNHATAGCAAASAPGNTMNLGALSGPLTFTLHDVNKGTTYDSVSPDGFGDYHVDIRTSYTYADVAAMSPALAAELGALPNVTFMAWEDLSADENSDFDYNDLIFAVSVAPPRLHAPVPKVPEPLTLSLTGAGILASFGLRRILRRPSA